MTKMTNESDVLNYSTCEIANIFWVFAPGLQRGGLTMLPQTLQLYNGFFPCYVRQKTGIPQNNAGCSTRNMQEFSKNFPRSDFDHCKLRTKFCKY